MTPSSIRAFLPLAICLLLGCSPPQDNAWRLPSSLREVSGLAATAEGRVLTMNDEMARVYEFDPVTHEIAAKFDLGDPVLADFEGISILDDHVYLVTSGGRLYVAGDERYETIDTGLSDICEVEGLESADGELLLLCKTNYQPSDRHKLLVYLFDPRARELRRHIEVDYETFGIDHLNPSAIATDQTFYYILAARQKRLLVIEPDGKYVALLKLSGHRQAEGIAVLANGEIIIADEGKNSGGTITRYESLSDIRQ